MNAKRIHERPAPPAAKTSVTDRPLAETLMEIKKKTGIPTDRLRKELRLVLRLADLFAGAGVPYALNGGAALNMIFLDGARRLPSDIDLRTDDIAGSRALLEADLQKLDKPAPLPSICCFVDRSGIEVDLAPNPYQRERKWFVARSIFCEYGHPELSVGVLSYDFEVLLADKIMALARKRMAKDLYDTFVSIGRDFDRKKLADLLARLEKHDRVDPTVIASPSYALATGREEPSSVTAHIDLDLMLSAVQRFIRGLLK